MTSRRAWFRAFCIALALVVCGATAQAAWPFGGFFRKAGLVKSKPMKKLEKKGVLALHHHKKDFPRPEDFAGWDLDLVPVTNAQLERFMFQLIPGVPPDIEDLVKRSTDEYGVDMHLVLGVIKAESDFNPSAVSAAGARGLMQLMPGTALDMGVTDIFDPAQNVAAGTQYLSSLLALFDDDPTLALAAYNAGPGNVKRYGGVPPFEETQTYVKRVQAFAATFAGLTEEPDIELAKAPKPPASALPETEGEFYTIYMDNGLTQPAEVIVSTEEYYLVTYGGRTERVNKDHVRDIVSST